MEGSAKIYGWFDSPVPPPRTSISQREQGQWGRISSVRFGSILQNHIEPEVNQYITKLREQGQWGCCSSVRVGSTLPYVKELYTPCYPRNDVITCSNHRSSQGNRPVVELDMSSGWFNSTEPPHMIISQYITVASGEDSHQFELVRLSQTSFGTSI